MENEVQQAVLLVILGWALGLLAPTISNSITRKVEANRLMHAIKDEARDTQYRLALISYMLEIKHGKIGRDFVRRILDICNSYQGSEKSEHIERFLNSMHEANDVQFEIIRKKQFAGEDIGNPINELPPNLIDANLVRVSDLPIGFQRLLHEFRIKLSVINQLASRANKMFDMTFDSNINDENMIRLKANLRAKYCFIARQCDVASMHLNKVLTFKQPWFQKYF